MPLSYVLLQYTVAVLGSASFVFGLLILGSEQFFTFWQNRYWKEKNDEHLQMRHIFYNRYTRGFSNVIVGLTLVYLAFFQF